MKKSHAIATDSMNLLLRAMGKAVTTSTNILKCRAR